jgi:hypothetical protein
MTADTLRLEERAYIVLKARHAVGPEERIPFRAGKGQVEQWDHD